MARRSRRIVRASISLTEFLTNLLSSNLPMSVVLTTIILLVMSTVILSTWPGSYFTIHVDFFPPSGIIGLLDTTVIEFPASRAVVTGFQSTPLEMAIRIANPAAIEVRTRPSSSSLVSSRRILLAVSNNVVVIMVFYLVVCMIIYQFLIPESGGKRRARFPITS